MSGIYIHIPFCKQACHYCDFHFSTVMKKKDEMIQALAIEIILRKEEAITERVETIYFGGGTPSVLEVTEILFLLDTIYSHYDVIDNPEITFEANPDDLTIEVIQSLASSPINRLSIGIQSFDEAELQMMNRAHNAEQGINCLTEAVKYFDNISIDLIYGIPGLSNEQWKKNIQMALDFGINHISSYALTVEPKTALRKLIDAGKITEPQDDAASDHFTILVEELQKHNFIHYELSNFGKEQYFSKNNSAYWLGKKYIGIGPSAHSFDGSKRGWNIANNSLYIKSIKENKVPIEYEVLSINDQYNEYIMTGLRTIWGVSLQRIQTNFGEIYERYLLKQAKKYLVDDLLIIENNILKATARGKFLTDGIAADLFMVSEDL